MAGTATAVLDAGKYQDQCLLGEHDTLVGSITAHSRHSLQMRITFHGRDHSGFYDGQIGFGAPACRSGHMLIGFGEINFAYQP